MKYGAVAAGHEVTAKVIMDVLKEGGNFADATVTGFLTACVAEPCMATIGGGGFANIMVENENHIVDFFCQTPRVKNKNAHYEPILVDFGSTQETYYAGAASIAVPGTIKGIFEIHRRYGRMPLKEVMAPAQKVALEGVALTPFQKLDLDLLENIFRLDKTCREVFFKGDELKNVGDNISMPLFASFLDVLASEEEDIIYKGEISKCIDEYAKANGGHLTRKDLEEYHIHWRKPKHVKFLNYELHLPGNPSLGFVLFDAYFRALPVINEPIGSAAMIESLIPSLLIGSSWSNNKERLFKASGFDHVSGGKQGGTSHFNILDKDRNGISMTFSIGEGSGYFVPGTNMQMNNMLGEEALLPNGLNSWMTDHRLASMMSPVCIVKDGRLKYLLGTGGAERIPTILALVCHYLFDYNMSFEEAIQMPRLHLKDHILHIENGLSREELKVNFELNYWDKKSLYFGGVHGIHQENDFVEAAGDDRREGFAIVE